MQDDIPEEYIYHRGISETSRYWSDFIMSKRTQGKVPVMIDDHLVQMYFVDCDHFGYPMKSHYEFLNVLGFPKIMSEGTTVSFDQINVYKKEIVIEEPVIHYQFRPNWSPGQHYIFMWSGRIASKEELPIEKLDVKYLMKLAQEAVKSREGIMIDDVMKNRLIK